MVADKPQYVIQQLKLRSIIYHWSPNFQLALRRARLLPRLLLATLEVAKYLHDMLHSKLGVLKLIKIQDDIYKSSRKFQKHLPIGEKDLRRRTPPTVVHRPRRKESHFIRATSVKSKIAAAYRSARCDIQGIGDPHAWRRDVDKPPALGRPLAMRDMSTYRRFVSSSQTPDLLSTHNLQSLSWLRKPLIGILSIVTKQHKTSLLRQAHQSHILSYSGFLFQGISGIEVTLFNAFVLYSSAKYRNGSAQRTRDPVPARTYSSGSVKRYCHFPLYMYCYRGCCSVPPIHFSAIMQSSNPSRRLHGHRRTCENIFEHVHSLLKADG